MEKISFLVPVYNAEAYLDNLVDSIMCQKTKNFEVILLNDGSTDNSLQKCNEKQKCYPDFIRVISRENKGAVRTRRELLEASSGEWIWIIDADDYIAPDAIEYLSGVIDSLDCDLVMFDHYHVQEKAVSICHQLDAYDGQVYDKENKKELYANFINNTKMNNLWNKFFRRRCVDFEKNYEKYEDVKRANDKLQTMAILTNAERVVYLRRPLYYYRFVQGGLSHIFKDYTYSSITKVNKRLEEYVEEWGLANELHYEMVKMKMRVVCNLLNDYCRSTRPSFKLYKVFFLNISGEEFYASAISEANPDQVDDYRLCTLVKKKRILESYCYILIRGMIMHL